MAKGPLGLKRPMVGAKLLVSENSTSVALVQVGPLGKRRPFVSASDDEISEERIQKCMESEGAHKFAEGLAQNPMVDDEQVEEATRSWCKGILQSTSIPTVDPAEVLPEENYPPEAEIIDVEGETIENTGEGLPESDEDA